VLEPKAVEQLALDSGLVKSLSEAKRLIAQQGIRLDGQPVGRDRTVEPSELPLLLSVGKRSVKLVSS
jgi:tyrosyl-tRNA synthetase